MGGEIWHYYFTSERIVLRSSCSETEREFNTVVRPTSKKVAGIQERRPIPTNATMHLTYLNRASEGKVEVCSRQLGVSLLVDCVDFSHYSGPDAAFSKTPLLENLRVELLESLRACVFGFDSLFLGLP